MRIPGFTIERLVAEGGMATVYRGVQESLGRTVALKVLRKFDRPDQSSRFLAEGQVIASLSHRHVITIYDIGRLGEGHYIAMEYLEGGSLTERIQRGMALSEVLDVLEAIGSCLDFVHARGVVHRDVKPDNVLFHADGTPKLTDFGIAKQFQDDQELTMDGSAFGSPFYLSPEQACGKPVDGRTDIYALGIVFYEMLTGRKPYVADSHVQTIVAHMNEPIPALPNRFAAYQTLLERMIAKSPDDRFSSAAELLGYVRGLRVAQTATRGRALRLAIDATSRRWVSALAALSSVSAAKIGVGVLLLVAAGGIALWGPRAGVSAKPPPREASTPGPTDAARGVSGIASGAEGRSAARAVSTPSAEMLAPAPQIAAEADHTPTDDARQTVVSVPAPPPADVAAGVSDTDVEPEPGPASEAASSDDVSVAALETESATPTEEERLAQSIDRWMAAAERSLRAYRLTTPRDDNAYLYYRKVLEVAPDHTAARAGLTTIADRYHAMARSQWRFKRNAQRARVYVRRGMFVQPDHAGLLALQAELRRAAAAPAATPVAERPESGAAARQDAPGEDGTQQGRSFAEGFKRFWRSLIH